MDRLILHYAPDNASLIVRLALETRGLTYETRLVDRRNRQQDSAAYRALNPAGLIPVLETPKGTLFETGAILLWLADSHGGLGPAPQDAARGDFLKWLFFVSNTLHAGLRMTFYPEKYVGADASAQQELRSVLRAALGGHLRLLDGVAAQGRVMGAAQPTVLDWYVATCLRWCALYPLGQTGWFALKDYPALARMAAALEQHPALQSARLAEGLGAAPFTAPVLAKPPEGSAT